MVIFIALAFIAMLIGLAVMGATLIYVVGIAWCWLSLTASKYEPELRTLMNAGDTVKKYGKRAIFSFRKTPGQRGAVIDSKK